ncbi:hypothetical protein I0P70_06625 [Pontibacter sp. FD36]|uniref:hypothetical protein n=1 Tax=Pontibacter sp. FD36 TaxID=2789860 RepID=UPI0018ABB6C5|nr:hypothetical protein [Pontibacter sp. FD36]MBF8962912.1 hypothetical protein [Pontibacter sp. FD36]
MESSNYILLYGPRQEDVASAVQQLTDLYAESGFTDGITVKKSTVKEDLYMLYFSNQPDFERFKYFVNYLTYPEVDNFKAKVLGYWTVTAEDNLPQKYIGQRALVYVSEQDTEGDNVCAVFEGHESAIKMGFASGEEYQVLGEKEFSFYEPQFETQDFSPLKTFTPDGSHHQEATKPGCSLMLATFLAFGFFLLWMIK